MRVTTIGSTGSVRAPATERSSGQPAARMRAPARRRVVGRLPQLGLAVGDPQPARGAVALVGQPDAAGVDEAHGADGAVVLLMGVPGHDERRRHAASAASQRSRRREPGQHLVVAARARVAVEDAVELERQRQLAERPRAARGRARRR